MKRNICDLALFGGRSAFADVLHVGRPNIGDRNELHTRIDDMLDRRWLTNDGPYVRELEMRLAKLLCVRHCILVSSGTVALELAIRASGMSGEVIVPSFTFIATAHALQWQNITPIFCDIDPRTHSIDPCGIENLLTSRTTGILGVHIWGEPCNITALTDIASRNHLKLLFDASHAFACTHHNRPIGSYGMAEVFSFHATKVFNTCEGGAVTTNNESVAAAVRLMRNFGFVDYDDSSIVGTNGKLSEVHAAVGLSGLECIEHVITYNRQNYRRYEDLLSAIPGVKLFAFNNREQRNYQYIVVEIDENITGISRDLVMQVLHAEKIRARRYFYPGCHNMTPYRRCVHRQSLEVTDMLCRRVLLLPTGTSINDRQIDDICEILQFTIARGSDIAKVASSAEYTRM